ncbi:MAG: protein-glutamate O-methyltransferase CheR [Pseudomonadota bacterium]|nr:protein-glutamate O-methyltransferase CheR [Pseudomonadota bacterium]
MQITDQEFSRFRTELESLCGIALGDGKEYLVASRLRKLLAQRNLPSVTELLDSMRRDRSLGLEVVDAMTTNETLWFRDGHPFEILRERIFPELSSRSESVRIWSAASSTGQEAYSIRIEESEFRKRAVQRLPAVSVLATDISTSALAEAQQGRYPWIAIRRGMPQSYLTEYFTQIDKDCWEILPSLREQVEFREFNLNDSYARLGKIDVIFCRNVLIYFSAERKRDILLRMHGALKEGGYLILGASEALNLPEHFDMISCRPGIVYQAKAVAAQR